MDIGQLAAEIAMLKQESMANKEKQRMGGFIDKYGTKFGNDTGIANLILAEMDRQGVSEASEAASEAVQGVLDKIREECTAFLSKTQETMKEASEMMQKINTIEEAVSSATAGTEPGAEGPIADATMGVPPPEGATPPPEGATPPPEGATPPPEGATPPPPDVATEPPVDAAGSMGAEPPPMSPEDPGAELPPPPPPPAASTGGFIPSDQRLKNIRSKFAAYKQTRTAQPKSVVSDTKLKNLLSGVRGLV